MTKTLRTLIPLSIVCALLIGFSYTQSAWTEPAAGTVAATNVAPPINTGTEDQVKAAGLGVDALAVYGDAEVDGILTNRSSVRSDQYCNLAGTSCLGGANLQYKLPVCTNGQTLVADAAGMWVCGAPSPTPPPTAWLVNNQHSETECIYQGGAIMTGSSGEKFCRFSQASCPSGWTRHNNYISYPALNCSRTSCDTNYCSAPGITWRSYSGAAPTCYVALTSRSSGGCDNSAGYYTCVGTADRIGCY